MTPFILYLLINSIVNARRLFDDNLPEPCNCLHKLLANARTLL